MIVKIRCLGKISSKLQYVKIIKQHSYMGLIEAKEFCELTMEQFYQEHPLEIKTLPGELEKDLQYYFDGLIQIHNKEKERQIKLVSLGLGDKSDLIQLLAEDMSIELLSKIRNQSEKSLQPIIYDYLADILTNFNSQQLDEYFNNKLIKEKQNG